MRLVSAGPVHCCARYSRAASVVAAYLLLLSACGGGDAPFAPVVPPPAQDPTGPGILAIAVTGLPISAGADVLVTGPSAFSRIATGSVSWNDLPPGTYTVAVRPIRLATGRYEPLVPSITANVTTGLPAPVTAQYRPAAAVIDVRITGLPANLAPAVVLTAPDSATLAPGGNVRISPASSGRWRVSAASVTRNDTTYAASPTLRDTLIQPGDTVSLVVAYAVQTGALIITTVNLPPGARPAYSLVSNSGLMRALSDAGTTPSIPVGSYTLNASLTTHEGIAYTPSPLSAPVRITADGTTTIGFSYVAATGGTNYAIAYAYLTQAIQTRGNTVRLVAGRDALLRVFVTASASNTARPDVRVRVYDGTTLLQTVTIPAPEAAVRTTVAEGTLASSWNVIVAAPNIRTTTRVLVELDPTSTTADSDRSDNRWPAGGAPDLISVRDVPPFTVRMVPVVIGTRTGNVSDANKAQFLRSLQRMFPLREVVSDVRAPFTSTAMELQSNDGNGEWLTVLSEINALRVSDGAPSTTHYYGVVRPSYTSGIAGYGYLPGRAAVGWDYLPSGDLVAAHEWGHNFSRNHAPCGVSGDASYPYDGGVISHFGWNSGTNAVVPPTASDVMGYCSNQWISDYTWSAVMQHRSTAGSVAAADATSAAEATSDGLLVWGRVVDGAIRLEPAFRVRARASARPTAASHRLTLLDANDAPLLELPLETARVDHVTRHEELQFAVVVPWSATLQARLAAIRVQDVRLPMRMAVRARSAQARRTEAPAAHAAAVGDHLRLSWDASVYPMVMVQDSASGQLMGFVRRPGDMVKTDGRAVRLVYSDGVRSEYF